MALKLPYFALAVRLVLALAAMSRAWSCGVEWAKPQTHFDGVNEYGYVSYWDQLGALELGDGLSLPLIIGFRSDWQRVSPYLGKGWFMGIFDSHFTQREEGAFDMIQPDGYTVPFGRDAKNVQILHGAKGWKAEINGDVISAYAACGWSLKFHQGKISAITTPQNRTYTIRRDSDGTALDITEDTKVVLKVERDANNRIVGLRVGTKHIGLERTEMPRIQNLHGQNIIAGIDWAVGKIVLPEGLPRTFDYAPDGQMQPTLKIGGVPHQERQIVWDAGTKFIRSDGSWRYEIKPATVAGHNAAIGRISTDQTQEFWHYDATAGKEVIRKRDGTQLISSWFTSGKLAGKLRKVEEVKGETVKALRQLAYGEDGRLIREIEADGSVEIFTYNQRGTRISSKNSPPTPEELERTEEALKTLVESNVDMSAKQSAIYELALFYIGRRHDSAKARKLADLISNPQKRFNVILQSFDHDPSLQPKEKISRYQQLLQEFPEARERLERLIQIRSTQT